MKSIKNKKIFDKRKYTCGNGMKGWPSWENLLKKEKKISQQNLKTLTHSSEDLSH